jgi:hypothetical protein
VFVDSTLLHKWSFILEQEQRLVGSELGHNNLYFIIRMNIKKKLLIVSLGMFVNKSHARVD